MAFERNTSDLHLHLNGSFSLTFLEKMASENGPEAVTALTELKRLRQQYKELREKLSATTESKGNEDRAQIEAQCEKLIWAQFPLIHKIVNKLDNIAEGTVDVVKYSRARYLEIRTSPKGDDKASRQPYIDTFVRGLQQANTQFAGQKVAYGLLSWDRSSCTPEAALEIVDAVVAEKERSGLLVGIDLSGNYLKPRKLTGEPLARAIKYALSKNIGLALHVGEVESKEEEREIDLILDTLEEWQKQQPSGKNPFHGKVRLGHGIFLTAKQIERIRELQLPMEICPACHEKLNWWKTGQKHPVTKIYSSWTDPVVPGTDDELFFGETAKTANRRVLDFLNYPKNQKTGAANAHQARFRFASEAPAPKPSYWRYGVFAAAAVVGLGVIAARIWGKGKADTPGTAPLPAPKLKL